MTLPCPPEWPPEVWAAVCRCSRLHELVGRMCRKPKLMTGRNMRRLAELNDALWRRYVDAFQALPEETQRRLARRETDR